MNITVNITTGACFWLFMIFFLSADVYLFKQGYDTMFYQYRTPAELQIQQAIIENMKVAK